MTDEEIVRFFKAAESTIGAVKLNDWIRGEARNNMYLCPDLKRAECGTCELCIHKEKCSIYTVLDMAYNRIKGELADAYKL